MACICVRIHPAVLAILTAIFWLAIIAATQNAILLAIVERDDADELSLEQQRASLRTWQLHGWDAALAQRTAMLARMEAHDAESSKFICSQSGRVETKRSSELLPAGALAVIGNGGTAATAARPGAIGAGDVVVRFNDFVRPLLGPNRTEVHVVNGRVQSCDDAPLVINLECNWRPHAQRPIYRHSSGGRFHPHKTSCHRSPSVRYCVPNRPTWQRACTGGTSMGTSMFGTNVPSRGFVFLALLTQSRRVRLFGFRGDGHHGRPKMRLHHYASIEHALIRSRWGNQSVE